MIYATLPLALLLFACTSAAQHPDMQSTSAPYAYRDVTATHMPSVPRWHAVDAAFIDVDSDGDLDLVVAVEHRANALFINDGTGKMRHVPDVFDKRSRDNEHVRSADFNQDGIADVIFVAEADEVHQLYFGDGKGGFTDMSARLPGGSQGNGLAVGDVNGDGLSDIVVGNTAEGKREEARNFLWLNDAARPGHFIDASANHLPSFAAHTQGVALADIDQDGDLDMVLANQEPPNRLLLNDGTGKFSDASERLELLTPLESREVHVFDANGDGHLDILFFNLTSNNHGWDKNPQTRLLLNDGKGYFKDASHRLPQHRFSSWGGMVIDFNRDGAPDLVVSAIDVPGFHPLQVRAWQNDGAGNFSDVSAQVIPAQSQGRSWSMAQGDVNGDGIPDLYIGSWRDQPRLLLGQ